MNFFHLFAVALLALNFTGQPVPENKTIVPAVVTPTAAPVNETEEFITWTNDRLLTWEDFKCEPRTGTDAVASTSTSLGIAYQLIDGELNYDITCNFSKVKSWGLMKTDYILAHEQGHFDITEIFARKLYEALQNYDFNKKTFKRDISEIYQSIVKQKEEFQKMYDGETDHSRNRKVQYEWLEKIQKMIDETQAFEMYP
jgi:hypothetical protein